MTPKPEARAMTKPTRARTAAQKRRDRRNARSATITLPGGEKAPQKPTGRDRRHVNQREASPMQTVLEARARRSGVKMEDVRDPLFGDDMGLCIAAMIPGQQDRANLEATYRHISASKRNWEQRIIGASPHPQSSSLPMLAEPMQTDESAAVDLRDPEERDEAARRSWEYWLEDLMALPREQRHALRGHIDGYADALWHEGELRPTRTGALAVKALQSLHERRTA